MRAGINRSFRAYAYSIRSPMWREGIFQKKTFIRYFHPEQSNNENSPISVSSSYIMQYNRPAYIDKTLLIEKLFAISRYALITAPRRFGKSLNMDMAKKFFEIEVDNKGKPIVLHKDEETGYLSDEQSSSKNFKLFEGKKIFENKEFASKHFGQYPILYVDFKDVSGRNFEEILGAMRNVLFESFQQHSYLENARIWRKGISKKTFMRYYDTEKRRSLDKTDLVDGLKFLSRCLHAHFRKKVYVFIDEFDAPVSKMIYMKRMKPVDQEDTIDFIQSIISTLVKSNEFVERSLLTGCHHVAGVLSQSANNIQHYPFMTDDNICEYYGFTKAEVDHLLKLDQYKREIPEKLYPQIHKWYNGYKKTLKDGSKISIYTPYGIVNYLQKPEKFNNYWIDNISKIVLNAMSHHCFRQKITEYMMSPEPFTINYISKLDILHVTTLSNIIADSEKTAENVDLYLQFMYENGYFNPVMETKDKLTLEIPNEAIREAIENNLFTAALIEKYYNHDPQKIDHFRMSMFTLATSRTRSDIVNLAKGIEELLLSGTPPCNEFDIHSVIYVHSRYKKVDYIRAECFTSLGTRCDVLILKNIGDNNYVIIIIEVKYLRDNSKKAYQQIFDKKYNSLSEVETARKLFKNDKINIEHKIYLGIHVSDDYKVTITFSFDGKDLKDLEDSNKDVGSDGP